MLIQSSETAETTSIHLRLRWFAIVYNIKVSDTIFLKNPNFQDFLTISSVIYLCRANIGNFVHFFCASWHQNLWAQSTCSQVLKWSLISQLLPRNIFWSKFCISKFLTPTTPHCHKPTFVQKTSDVVMRGCCR